MNYRKILGNILASLLSPIFLLMGWLPEILKAIVFETYHYYDFKITSFPEYLKVIYFDSLLPLFLISLFLIFLPFQLIKDFYYSRNRSLGFGKKVLILSGILIVIFLIWGSFTNIWVIPWYVNLLYIAFSVAFGVVFSMLLNLMVDKRVENKIS